MESHKRINTDYYHNAEQTRFLELYEPFCRTMRLNKIYIAHMGIDRNIE